jgi:hypothetical protein
LIQRSGTHPPLQKKHHVCNGVVSKIVVLLLQNFQETSIASEAWLLLIEHAEENSSTEIFMASEERQSLGGMSTIPSQVIKFGNSNCGIRM